MANARILRREARAARKAFATMERTARTTLADVKKAVTAFTKADPCERAALRPALDAKLENAEPGIGPAYLKTIREAVDKAALVPCKIKK